MNGLMAFVGMTIGGWVGWAVGAGVSLFVAFLLSIVGTGLGLWAARRFVQAYF
jgi:hypothetical protein